MWIWLSVCRSVLRNVCYGAGCLLRLVVVVVVGVGVGADVVGVEIDAKLRNHVSLRFVEWLFW